MASGAESWMLESGGDGTSALVSYFHAVTDVHAFRPFPLSACLFHFFSSPPPDPPGRWHHSREINDGTGTTFYSLRTSGQA
jgi:hypothetical protein